MRATKTKIISFFASCLYVLTAGFPVLADDTDIFVGGAGSTSSKTTNVLFIIDNSGSMADPPARLVALFTPKTL
jgi:hypothetical protein